MTPEVQPVVSGGSSSQLDISAGLTDVLASTPKSPHSVRVSGEGPQREPSDTSRYPNSKMSLIWGQTADYIFTGVMFPSLIGSIPVETGWQGGREELGETAVPSNSRSSGA